MLRFFVIAAAVSLPLYPALAQPIDNISQDWVSAMNSLRHVQEDLQALVKAQGDLAAERAYWKAWCGSSPGCDAGKPTKP